MESTRKVRVREILRVETPDELIIHLRIEDGEDVYHDTLRYDKKTLSLEEIEDRLLDDIRELVRQIREKQIKPPPKLREWVIE